MIDYLQEENRALRDQLSGKRLRFTDVQRMRLGDRVKNVGRRKLILIGTVVTPGTLRRCHRELVAKKYDGSRKRGPGRPPKPNPRKDFMRHRISAMRRHLPNKCPSEWIASCTSRRLWSCSPARPGRVKVRASDWATLRSVTSVTGLIRVVARGHGIRVADPAIPSVRAHLSTTILVQALIGSKFRRSLHAATRLRIRFARLLDGPALVFRPDVRSIRQSIPTFYLVLSWVSFSAGAKVEKRSRKAPSR